MLLLSKCMQFDVAVFGGGTSGIAAAVAAARNGARVILVERNPFLGGTLISGLGILGYRDRSGAPVIGGIAQEIIDLLSMTEDTLGHNYCPILNSLTPVNSAMLQLRLMELCRNAGVHVLLNCEFFDLEKKGAHIQGVQAFGKSTRYDIRANVYIDATGDGELCYRAGVPLVKRENPGEMQPASQIFSMSNVDREKMLRYLEENPDEAKTPEGYEMETSVDTYRNARGYNVLGCDALIRAGRENGDYIDIPRDRFSTITHPIPDQMIINNTRIMNFDGSDLLQLTDGIVEGYRQLKELLHFIPRYIPGYEDAQLATISPMLGIRESRRCVGRKTLTSGCILRGEVPDDSVALGGYNIDIHHGSDEGSELYIVEHGYGIPYGTMISDTTDNLIFTGRLISVDTDTYGSTRIMGTCMALGEAAGCAAALCIKNDQTPLTLDVSELRETLLHENAILKVNQDEV